MSYVETLHQERVDRLARIAAAAKPIPIVPRPIVPPVIRFAPRIHDPFEEYAWRVEIEGIEQQEYRHPSIYDIRGLVCGHYGIELAALLSARRTHFLIQPKHVAYYLSFKLTLKSLPEIGRRLGGKDHTTVLHGVRKIERLLLTDAALRDTITLLKQRLGAHDVSDQRRTLVKLDEDEVRAIRGSTLPDEVLAEKYDVSAWTVGAIKSWRTWKKVE